MIRHRSDGQVVEAARQIDAALEDGLNDAQMLALVAARAAWRDAGRMDLAAITDDLLEALRSPAATAWDAIFTRRARVELGVTTEP